MSRPRPGAHRLDAFTLAVLVQQVFEHVGLATVGPHRCGFKESLESGAHPVAHSDGFVSHEGPQIG